MFVLCSVSYEICKKHTHSALERHSCFTGNKPCRPIPYFMVMSVHLIKYMSWDCEIYTVSSSLLSLLVVWREVKLFPHVMGRMQIKEPFAHHLHCGRTDCMLACNSACFTGCTDCTGCAMWAVICDIWHWKETFHVVDRKCDEMPAGMCNVRFSANVTR